MRIALVNQWYPPDYGGVGVYNGVMARAYVALGHQVTVITARAGDNAPVVADQEGVRVYRVRRPSEPYVMRRLPLLGPHVRSLRHLAYSYKVSSLLRQLALQQHFDVVEFAEINAEGLFAALHGNPVPAVVRCHTPHALLRQTHPDGHYFQTFDTSLIEMAEAATVQRAAALTAPSADLARRIEEEMRVRPGRVTVIPNAIDTGEFTPCATGGEQTAGQSVTILHVGRLGSEKGIFVLAEALALLAARERTADSPSHVPWRAIFAGGDRTDASGGSNKEQLDRFFAEHGLASRVELRGFVAQEELVSLYRRADLCVVPSILYESFSYTCLQAMACGRPLVATTMGGIPEVVADGETGLLVPPGDPAALAHALERLIDDPALRRRLGDAGRERAVRLYDHHVVAEQNLALYMEAVERRIAPGHAALAPSHGRSATGRAASSHDETDRPWARSVDPGELVDGMGRL